MERRGLPCRRLFTLEAALLGFWGGVFGLGVGYGLTRVANIVLNGQLKHNGLSVTNIITFPLWLIACGARCHNGHRMARRSLSGYRVPHA